MLKKITAFDLHNAPQGVELLDPQSRHGSEQPPHKREKNREEASSIGDWRERTGRTRVQQYKPMWHAPRDVCSGVRSCGECLPGARLCAAGYHWPDHNGAGYPGPGAFVSHTHTGGLYASAVATSAAGPARPTCA